MMMRAGALSLACFALLVAACSHADGSSPEEPAGGQGGAGTSGGGATSAGGAGQGGAAGSDAGGKGGQAGGAAGVSGGSGKGGAAAGAAGKAGSDSFGGGGEPGNAGDGGDGGNSFVGGAGTAGMSGGSGGSGASAGTSGGSSGGPGGSGAGAAPGWTCGASPYAAGDHWPACNCDCGVHDPDCDDPDSYVKGCGKGQTCGADGACQGPVLSVPSAWVCGSAYYAIGGQVPVCDCGCGAPDPDCALPHPTYNLTKCGKGQTCGADGACQGPVLSVPATWTCAASRFAEGKTSGTCDCDCGSPDPDCADQNLTITGCGYKQTCSSSGTCQGDIAPAPAGWTCASAAYSDGKLCNCEACGLRDPDCDVDGLPDDCGPDAFCGSLTNECIDMAN